MCTCRSISKDGHKLESTESSVSGSEQVHSSTEAYLLKNIKSRVMIHEVCNGTAQGFDVPLMWLPQEMLQAPPWTPSTAAS